MDSTELMGISFVLGILSIGASVSIFIIKQINDIKKEIAKLCERIAREETKSQVYHPNGLIRKGYENIEPHDLMDK